MTNPTTATHGQQIQSLFAEVAAHYDRVNRIVTLCREEKGRPGGQIF